MSKIESVRARQILDSRGNPTVEAIVSTECCSSKAAVPSGASTGANEALELRDEESAYHGKGVKKAVNNIREEIAPELRGMDITAQTMIDRRMISLDGTEDKSALGANAILAVSLAAARTASKCLDIPLHRYLGRVNDTTLPVPFMNVLNGGEHAGNGLDIQEYMIVPEGAKTFSEAVMMASEVYHDLGEIIEMRYGGAGTNVGDEGGYAPPLEDPLEPFDLIEDAIEKAGYKGKVSLALDAAASEFHTPEGYSFADEILDTSEMIAFYERLVEEYPIISLEDPLGEEDWDGFSKITESLADEVQIVGDDLFVSDPEIIRKGIEREVCNCVLLKVNQIGTLMEAMNAASLAHRHGYEVQVSHRSGETCDDFIADLSLALSTGQLKAGAPARGERTAKYNRLLRIEQDDEEMTYPSTAL